nr:uncharacterized protein LOC113698821 [Coffea arabica]
MNQLYWKRLWSNCGRRAPKDASSVNNHNEFPPYERPCSPTFQCLIVVTIFTILVGGVIGVLVRLWPRSPKFEIISASVSPFDMVGSNLTATWNITFDVKNPNQGRLSYEDVEVSVSSGNTNTLLVWASQSGFDQPKKSHVKYEAIISTWRLPIADETVSNPLIEDRVHGVAAFSFQVHARYIYVPVPPVSSTRHITVDCNNVKIEVGANNSFNVIRGRFKSTSPTHILSCSLG